MKNNKGKPRPQTKQWWKSIDGIDVDNGLAGNWSSYIWHQRYHKGYNSQKHQRAFYRGSRFNTWGDSLKDKPLAHKWERRVRKQETIRAELMDSMESLD